MTACAACGHQLGLGRFCTNCGHPVDDVAPDAGPLAEEWRTDTAERSGQRPAPPVVAPPTPRIPPAAVTPPPPPRYPLYADEIPSVDPALETADAAAEPALVPGLDPAEPRIHAAPTIEEPEPAYDWEPDEDERRSALTWMAAVLLIAVLAVGGWLAWEYFRDDAGSPADPQAQDGSPSGNGEPDPVDVASGATAVAPETAPPMEDVNGELVSFDASNMLDGVPETAWRARGSAKGMELTFRLPRRTTLTSVGMINGYDKRSEDAQGRTFDWYRGNRRVEAVVWDFGEGTTIRQKFGEDRAMQSIDIDPVTTRKVVVRLVGVSEPGEGRASQDYTAISEVSLLGEPD